MTGGTEKNAKTLGIIEQKLVASFVAPLFWVEGSATEDKRVFNGTACFVDTGERLFAVTAYHVMKQHWASSTPLHLSNLDQDFANGNRLIDSCDDIDLATFEIQHSEIKSIGKDFIRGTNHSWPPSTPQQDQAVCWAGFPVKETLGPENMTIEFGTAMYTGVVASTNERDISVQIETEKGIALLGKGVLPPNYRYSGISGSLLVARTECSGIEGWSLAGIIYEGPNPQDDTAQAITGLEIIKARKSDFIHPDGTLNRSLWNNI
jgi:hypothetical protein